METYINLHIDWFAVVTCTILASIIFWPEIEAG